MPTPLAVDDIIRVTYLTRLASQQGLNIRFYKVTAFAGASLTFQEAADSLSAQVNASIRNLMTNSAGYEGLMLQRVAPAMLESPVRSTANIGVGTAGTQPLPGNTAGIFTLTTGFIGRANRGRTYVPFPDSADLTTLNGNPCPTVGYMTRLGVYAAFHAALQVLTNGANGVTIRPVLYGGTPPTTIEITGATARQKWATIHRRGSYGQPNITIG